MDGPCLTRRGPLLSLAALLAGGCGVGGSRPSPPWQAGHLTVQPFGMPEWFASAAARAGFHAWYPAASLVAPDGGGAPWGLGLVDALSLPSVFADLGAALRARNFDWAGLVPGAQAAMTGPTGGVIGVPLGAQVHGVLYNTRLFDVLGVDAPPAAWDLDQFTETCAQLDAAAKQRAGSGFGAALGPLVGFADAAGAGGVPMIGIGALEAPWIWASFIEGYGGSIVEDGRFVLDTPQTYAGLARLVDIAKSHSALTLPIPHDACALLFAAYWPDASYEPYRFVPLPSMPTGDVALIDVLGVRPGVLGSPDGPLLGHGVPEALCEAAVAFAQWWYAELRQGSAVGDMWAPVLADARVQDAYWSDPGRVRGGSARLALWRRWRVADARWPLDASTVSGAMFSMLTRVVASGESLRDGLRAVGQTLNDQLAAGG